MSLDKVLERHSRPPSLPTMLELDKLTKAKKRVLDRWPDIISLARDDEHEAIIKQFIELLREDIWAEVRMSFVTKAFRVAFLPKYQGRSDVKEITDFAVEELQATTNQSLVTSMANIYLATFSKVNNSTKKLGQTLTKKEDLLSPRWKSILSHIPEFFVQGKISDSIAELMLSCEKPWQNLIQIGLIDPHALGLMEYVHETYIDLLKPQLSSRNGFDRLLLWLNPEQDKIKTSGSEKVIEAILGHWLTNTPDENLRQYITENLILFYDDPRIRKDKWITVDDKYMDVIYRWLTKEDLRFFTSVVDANQRDPMWVPRRDFWLKLYDEGLIDQAWVAFCPSAAKFARERLTTGRSELSLNRFARQTGRADTSILMLKIGSKVFVDGCHNYSTHVWNVADPQAPPLFKSNYDCDNDLRKRSPVGRGKSHAQIESWKQWVREIIYTVVPMATGKPIDWDLPTRNFHKENIKSNIRQELIEPPQAVFRLPIADRPLVESTQNHEGILRNEQTLKVKNLETTTTIAYDINKDILETDLIKVKRHVFQLRQQLSAKNINTNEIDEIISKIPDYHGRRNLQTYEKKTIKLLFDKHLITKENYPTLYLYLQPIFNLEGQEPNYEAWSAVAKKVQSTADRLRISSPKSTTALKKLGDNKYPLVPNEVNALEHLLQSMRWASISIDSFFG